MQISRKELAWSLDSRNGINADPSKTAYRSLTGSMGEEFSSLEHDVLFPEAAPLMISSGECLRFLREPPRSERSRGQEVARVGGREGRRSRG